MSDRGRKQMLMGKVIRNSGSKTVIVEVSRKVKHSVYKKYVIKKKKYMAHDEKGQFGVGDKVNIIASRPISKTKRWRVTELLEKGKEE
jgi:small subunit ribosomal protein S17|tara:strand:- start:691 stop:954 length:264 start_codon:yes stop_codon:yes gene_type:complete